jgi:hypothetical protein
VRRGGRSWQPASAIELIERQDPDTAIVDAQMLHVS